MKAIVTAAIIGVFAACILPFWLMCELAKWMQGHLERMDDWVNDTLLAWVHRD